MLESPKPPLGVVRLLHHRGVEAATVVGDGQRDGGLAELQAYLDARGPGVLAGVGDRFLRHAQQGELDIAGERARRRQRRRGGRAVRRGWGSVSAPRASTSEPVSSAAGLRFQTERRASSSAARAVGFGGAQLGVGAGGVGADEPARRADLKGEGQQRLGEGVVDLARQAVALRDDAEVAAGRVEAGVFDGDGRVLGQVGQQFDLALAEAAARVVAGHAEGADDLVLPPDRNGDPRSQGVERRSPEAAPKARRSDRR